MNRASQSVWPNLILGFAVLVLLFAGVNIVPQPGRAYPENLFWQAIIVALTGFGWVVGIAPAVVAARRGGWWMLGVFLIVGASSFALVWLGTDRQAGALARALAVFSGIGMPLAVGVMLRLALG
jgi:hypothetical protein